MILNLISKAKDLFYSNKNSGLSATNVQGAIDELSKTTSHSITWVNNAYYIGETGYHNKIVKNNNVKNLQLFMKCASPKQAEYVKVYQLPEGTKPSNDIFFTAVRYDANNTNSMAIKIATDGYLYCSGGVAGSSYPVYFDYI